MMNESMAKNVLKWIYKEYKKLNPDIIVPIGHRVANLLLLYKNDEMNGMFDKIIDVNALRYQECRNKCIMLIDEETEYGRKFLYDAFLYLKHRKVKSTFCFTVFLNNDSEAKNLRKDIIEKLKQETDYKIFAKSLENIRAFKSFEDNNKFHKAIFNFRKFIKTKLDRPYNSDATKFYLTFNNLPYNFERNLSEFGILIMYDQNVFSLFPHHFNIRSFGNLNGVQLIDEVIPKLRFFKSGASVVISPMVYIPVEFRNLDFTAKTKTHTLLHQMLRALEKHTKISKDNQEYLLQLYDIIIFWLDVELFKSFILWLQKKEITFQFKLDKDLCLTHYGKNMGEELFRIISDHLHTILSNPPLDLYAPKEHEGAPFDIQADTSTLLLIKAACLKQYDEMENIFQRMGLTFSGIQKELRLNPLSVSVCIDILCDNAVLKPFDLLETPFRVNRFYNTDVEEFIGFFVKLVRRTETKGLPLGKMNINKITAYLDYFVLSLNDKFRGHLKVIYAPEGKVAHVVDEDKDINERIERLLLKYPKYKEIFYYDKENKIFKIREQAFKSEYDFQKHLSIIKDEHILDIHIDIVCDLYNILQRFIKEHDIIDSKGRRRTIYDAFPGLVELMGKDFPEGGLTIIGKLTKQALSHYELYLYLKDAHYKKSADELLFHSIPHKINMYQTFAEAYFECYKYLSAPYDSNRGLVWQNMCVFPQHSLILKLCSYITNYLQKNLEISVEKIELLEEKVEKFLNLMINCASSEPASIPKVTSNSWYMVSVDLKNSTKMSELYDPRWKKIHSYLINIMCRWAEIYQAKLINLTGDGIIVAFSDPYQARSFAAACCIHLNEITESINRCETFKSINTGCYVHITHGITKIDENGNCISSELNTMCKYLPKIEGKIVVDAKTIDINEHFKNIKIIKENRPYCIIDPNEEFDRMILSEFV